MKKFAAILVGFSAFLMSGCFDIEQTLTLERDMSGKAGFSMKVDMEPMVVMMAAMQKSMSGKTGDPTPAEIAAARKDFTEKGTTSSTGDFEKEKKELEGKLPKGVKLLDATFKDEGLKVAAMLTFAFDNASKLSQIVLPKKEGAAAGPGDNPVDTPFEDLTLVDDGKTVLITSTIQNPMADETAQAPPDAEMQKQIASMFGTLRVAFKITAPFEILEQNATRKEGNTLIWEYDVKSLAKMTPAQLKDGIRVRYKK